MLPSPWEFLEFLLELAQVNGPLQDELWKGKVQSVKLGVSL